MMSFRESRSFLWYTSEPDILGQGSFGLVYRGIHKTTGDAVAVKIPHSNVMIPEEVEAREIEVYKKVNHVNIVKLIGYEEETCHRRERPKKVLVMELCDGGSLFKILEHPKNHFGLEEEEFLTVLRDLTSGMKYLRENDIIHRDLKPANIMRCISDDGSSIYKITDFGAARELAENQEYSSIFGTEEYLHPDVYEQALLPDSHIPNKKFSPSTDLWSIGATLYHVATGMLPFRPINGRKNKKVMHLMTTKKESGVISAYQKKEDDETDKIYFEKHLPKNCLLSPDLKRLICPLLAGLMEVDPRKKLTFEKYFQKVEEILSRRQLHIFYFNKLQPIKLYIQPNETKTWQDLENLIEEFTKVEQRHQILLFKDCTLKTLLVDDAENICTKLPITSERNPVVLCSRTNEDVSCKHDRFNVKKKLFPNTIEYNKDADIATHNCLVAYCVKRHINSVCLKVKLIDSSIQTINQVVVAQLTAASKENMLIGKAVHSMRNQFEMMQCFHALCTDFAKLVPEDVNNMDEDKGTDTPTFHESIKQLSQSYISQLCEFQKLEKKLQELKPSIDALLGSRVQNRFLMNAWEEASKKVKGVNDFVRIERISSSLVSQVDASYVDFTGNVLSHAPQRRRAPMPEEECLHLIERVKMIQTMDKLERLQTECLLNMSSLNSVVSDWYKRAIGSAYVQPEILSNEIKNLQEMITVAEEKLVTAANHFKVQLGQLTNTLSAFPNANASGTVENRQNERKAAKVKAVRDRLHELVRVQEEIQQKFKTNFELCDQLQGLLTNSFVDQTAIVSP